jgi:predicted nucleotidyltransferase
MDINQLANQKDLQQFCRKWQVIELAMFGSALRPDFNSASDIDLLVAFKAKAHHTLFDLVTMREELMRLFGRPVDLISRRGLERSANYLRRAEILSTAKSIYAAAA